MRFVERNSFRFCLSISTRLLGHKERNKFHSSKVCSLLFACLVTATGASTSAGEPGNAVLIDVSHERADARLVGVSADGLFTFQVGKQARRIPAAELVAWGAPAEPRDAPQLILADGSLLVVRDVLKTDEQRLLVDSDTFGEFAVPLEMVAGILLHPPIDPQRRDLLAKRFTPGADQDRQPSSQKVTSPNDRVLLENGDELSGRITAVTDTAVEFAGEVGPLTIDRQRIIALGILGPSASSSIAPRDHDAVIGGTRTSPQGRLLIGLRGGSLFYATTITMDHQQVQAELGGELKLAAPPELVVFAQTIGGRAIYLSDLESDSYRHLPFLSVEWPYQLDANVTGTRLRAGGQIYAKGIGMHSTSRLTYGLEKPYRRFEADLAIDDQTQRRGSVVFRVLAGTREIYKSGVVRGGDMPVPVSVNVSGVRQLSLVVDYADRADELDHADWLNARLVE